MGPRRTRSVLVLTTAAAAATLLLGGCGADTAQRQSTSQPVAPMASPSAPSSASGAAEPTSSSPSPASIQPTTRSGPAPCKAAGLTASTDATGGGAAGSVYVELILTNSGSQPCLLRGFPGVSLTTDANGEPIGAAAVRDASSPVTDVVLAPGRAGTATLRYTQAGNYPDCSRTEAAGFRIYPPGDTASLFVADPRDACSNADIKLLTIGAFQAK